MDYDECDGDGDGGVSTMTTTTSRTDAVSNWATQTWPPPLLVNAINYRLNEANEYTVALIQTTQANKL